MFTILPGRICAAVNTEQIMVFYDDHMHFIVEIKILKHVSVDVLIIHNVHQISFCPSTWSSENKYEAPGDQFRT